MSQPYPPSDPNQPPAAPNTPSYGSTGYTPSNYSESPYGGQAATPAPPPAAAPSYSSAAYGYGSDPVGTPTQQKPTIGIAAFALTVLAAILYCVFAGQGASATMDLFNLFGTIDIESASPEVASSVEAQNLALAMGGWLVAQAVPAILGLVGFILGIVSAVQNKGRLWGILAIVLAVIGPIAGFMVYSVGVAGAVELM